MNLLRSTSQPTGRLALITTCLVASLAAPVTAATIDAQSCYGAYYTHVDVMQVAPNHVIVTAGAHGTGYVTRDAQSPLKGAYGPCVLFNEVIDGKPNGELRCVRSDAQGDKFLITGKVKAYTATGAMTGSYTSGIVGMFTPVVDILPSSSSLTKIPSGR